jgi:hypothetical protein
MNLGLIVEGYGEVQAAPVLVRRLASWLAPDILLAIPKPLRIGRQKIVKPGELERVIEFMARAAGPRAPLLVLLDADEGCPKAMAPDLLARARAARSDREIAIVLAKFEFESWFLAALSSLSNLRTLRPGLQPPADPESVRGAKEYLGREMTSGYSETLDQPAFAAAMDLHAARRADSFDKLVRDVGRLLGVDYPPRAA